jgi:hypothetical protein
MTSLRNWGVTPDGSNSTSGNSCATGRFTQKTVIVEGLEEIQNPTKARRYLEKTLLIVPPGQVISPASFPQPSTMSPNTKEYLSKLSMQSDL